MFLFLAVPSAKLGTAVAFQGARERKGFVRRRIRDLVREGSDAKRSGIRKY